MTMDGPAKPGPLPRNELREPYVDRRAMLPLALIYARQADTTKFVQLQKELASFTPAMFDAKNDAYRAGDIVQIREFHMTLGAMYAARDRGTGRVHKTRSSSWSA
jgi:hypothetical protein